PIPLASVATAPCVGTVNVAAPHAIEAPFVADALPSDLSAPLATTGETIDPAPAAPAVVLEAPAEPSAPAKGRKRRKGKEPPDVILSTAANPAVTAPTWEVRGLPWQRQGVGTFHEPTALEFSARAAYGQATTGKRRLRGQTVVLLRDGVLIGFCDVR